MARKHKKPVQLTIPQQDPYGDSWASVGWDVSMTSVSGAMLIYDSVLDKMRGPGVFSVRWERDVHFLDRLAQAVKAHEIMYGLMQATAPCNVPIGNFWIGVEEPWPAGIVKRAESGWLRQQAQIQGAFIGGLVKHGYKRVYEVNAQSWRVAVAHDLGMKVNKEFTKFVVKKWAIDQFGIEDRPDLIKHSTRGLVPRPETSKAKAVQPDDIYDACGIMAWMDDERASLTN